ncbi:MAG: protein translocase subunit SecD [Thermodesulfobacteriota bacterium]
MNRVSRGWIILILLLSLMCGILLVPTFAGDRLPSWWGKVFPSQGIRLGLDLKGGIFLLLGVQTEKAVDQELNSIKEILTKELKDQRILTKGVKVDSDLLRMDFFSKDDLEKAIDYSKKNFENIADISSDNLSLSININSSYVSKLEENSVDQVRQVIENRVKDFGLVEPSIQKSGDGRILIQIPGASNKDRERIVNLIKKAAVLEFKIVEAAGLSKENLIAGFEAASEEELAQRGLSIHEGRTGNQNEAYFVTEDKALVTGEYISDARITFDDFNRPAVGFRFRGEGATKFGELTSKNIGKRLAIVLDGVIKSAPTIQDKITYQGTITGTFTPDESKDLALILRSGALPVPVEVEQERTVGPSLGKDSISKGKLSMAVGGVLVIIFMVIFYKLQGVVANIALLLNMLFIMGFLSAFGVTLTLPGIAGLVLTLGMAVDGNIIIFERIKEEIRLGKSAINSINAGYSRSLWTILDANITTLVTALILFWFGTGPIKGFAATLSIGILSTVFSNVIVAKVITSLFYRNKQITAVSI